MSNDFFGSAEARLIPYEASQRLESASALVLAPHADDEVFGCGGAILQHVQGGTRVDVIVLTDGAAGGAPDVRRAESIAAAQVLGYGEPVFWELADRALVYTEALVLRLLSHMEAAGVDLLYAPSPWEIHPDHRQASAIALEAARRYQRPVRLALYEVGAPLQPNFLLDISAVLSAKEAAMACFASQLQNQNYAQQMGALNRYRTYTLPRDVSAAEAYRLVLPTELHAGWSEGLRANPLLPRDASALPAKQPLVSILIRSMDLDCLAQALDSVALQDYANIEVVVVAARPGHRPLPSRCGPFPLRLVTTESALPRSRAANVGLQNASGDFLMFLDDDDWLMPGHVKRLATVLRTCPEAPAAYTGVGMVDEQGAPIGQAFDMPFDPARLLAGNLTPIHGVLFRKTVLDRGCRVDETLDRYEDWDFWLQISRLGPMVHLPGVSAVYRIHASSGVHEDVGPLGTSAQEVYEKWRSQWSRQELGAMMQRVWSFSDMETQLQAGAQEQARLREELVSHREAISKLYEDSVRQQEISIQQKETIARQSERLMEQELLIADQARQIVSLYEQRAQLQSEVAKQANTLEFMQRQLNSMLHSRSWRLTRPLRWVTSWFQR